MCVERDPFQRVLSAGALSVRLRRLHSGTAKHHLTLYIVDRGPTIDLELEHNTAIVSDELANQLLLMIEEMLTLVAKEPDPETVSCKGNCAACRRLCPSQLVAAELNHEL
jgi:hypothetical protein